ncbi:MAG TPA: hypothetical protein DDX72_02215 [Ruminococcaceae bacterium]|nr:hypothetical protein [Oscillospiraceae bacterium]
MNKSVYSLVLSDEVVAAVDRAAYRAGMSRSAFINSVLAEAVSYTTPEKRMSDIFSEIEQLMSGDIFRIMPRPSDSALAIRSALKYKYKPVIRYGIELYRSFDTSIGKLKVSLRTQSDSLIAEFERFTGIWVRLEQEHIISHFPDGITYETGDGKFTRTFCLPPDKHKLTDDGIAEALSEYIKMFDDIIKLYFANCSDHAKAQAIVRKRYEEYYAGNMPII